MSLSLNCWYMCAQVIKRNDVGRVIEWYEGDKVPDVATAKAEVVRSAKMFPGTEFTVLSFTMREITNAKKVVAEK